MKQQNIEKKIEDLKKRIEDLEDWVTEFVLMNGGKIIKERK